MRLSSATDEIKQFKIGEPAPSCTCGVLHGIPGRRSTVCTQDRVLEDRGKTGAKGGFSVTNSDGSLVGPWNAMVCSPLIGGLAERMGSFCRHQNACAPEAWTFVEGSLGLLGFEGSKHSKTAHVNLGIKTTKL